ncbi:unnamed protein product [Pedinophyceae sp. YPF-701]|nr:unnamed protein product [Pedinophyceae sp. YPF-701]
MSRRNSEDAPTNGRSTHVRTGSFLDLAGACMEPQDDRWRNSNGSGSGSGSGREAPSIVLPNQDGRNVCHFAIDIGGSLIKIVYFTDGSSGPDDLEQDIETTPRTHRSTARGGKLHFVKFETSKVHDAINFIREKGLHRRPLDSGGRDTDVAMVKATGGGAYKYADLFKQELGVVLEKEDEIGCLVAGAGFLLRAIRDEAFTFQAGVQQFVPLKDDEELYPYLLVNVGSGVSMIKVSGHGEYERVSGTNLGGGTFLGLCRLLTGTQSFEELLSLSVEGDNTAVDMLVGDIYGGHDYEAIGLSAGMIASSFGKVVMAGDAQLEYRPQDIALALMRMVSYNIGQIAYLNASLHSIRRVFFGGFFIRGHPYTMETISYAINFWSKGIMQAMFLRHEGFLGVMGSFLTVRHGPIVGSVPSRAKFVERFRMGAPFLGGTVQGPLIGNLEQKVSWVERFIEVGSMQMGQPPAATDGAEADGAMPQAPPSVEGDDYPSGGDSTGHLGDAALAHPALNTPEVQMMSQLKIDRGYPAGFCFERQAPGASPPASLQGAPRRVAPQQSPKMSLNVGVLHWAPSFEPFPLLADPGGYEPNTVDIIDDPEEREYWLSVLLQQVPMVEEKAFRSDANAANARRRAHAFARALTAHLHRLKAEPGAYGRLGLAEIFEMREECLREFNFRDAYRLDKAQENTAAIEVLPDLFRELDAMPPAARLLPLIEGVLAANIFDWGSRACVELYKNGTILEIYRDARARLSKRPWRADDFDALSEQWHGMLAGGSFYRRALLFVDNAGADLVLGMIPLARELLRHGTDVVMAANSLPAINDVTAGELEAVLQATAHMDAVLSVGWEQGVRARASLHSFPRIATSGRRSGGGGTVRVGGGSGAGTPEGGSRIEGGRSMEEGAWGRNSPRLHDPVPSPARTPPPLSNSGGARIGRLFVVESGQGGPCLDLRRVSQELAEAATGTDLIVIEGMGRALHTNLRARFKCDTVKLAMVKNARVGERLFGGGLYDCCCIFEKGAGDGSVGGSPARDGSNLRPPAQGTSCAPGYL